MRVLLCASALVACLSSQALALYDLQITEIWPGNFPNDSNGDNQTGDWFELTNLGDMAWTSADGTLYFDDSSPAVANADQMFGITSIAPGESVIYVDDDLALPALTLSIWHGLWDTPLTNAGKSVPQVGYYGGSGLGGGGDEVNVFLDTDANLEISDIIDSEDYVDADSSGGQSWDVPNGIYSHPSYAVVTAANDNGNPSTGTPGYIATVPEPASLVLGCVGVGFVCLRRRK
jgi:hypothetical protein